MLRVLVGLAIAVACADAATNYPWTPLYTGGSVLGGDTAMFEDRPAPKWDYSQGAVGHDSVLSFVTDGTAVPTDKPEIWANWHGGKLTGNGARSFSFFLKTRPLLNPNGDNVNEYLHNCIFSYGDAPQRFTCKLIGSDGNVNIRCEVGNGGWRRGGIHVADGLWHHVAISLPEGGNTDSIGLWIDGVDDNGPPAGQAFQLPSVNGNTIAIDTGSAAKTKMGRFTLGFRLRIEAEEQLGGVPYIGFPGWLDDFRTYDVALTGSDVEALEQGGEASMDPYYAWDLGTTIPTEAPCADVGCETKTYNEYARAVPAWDGHNDMIAINGHTMMGEPLYYSTSALGDSIWGGDFSPKIRSDAGDLAGYPTVGLIAACGFACHNHPPGSSSVTFDGSNYLTLPRMGPTGNNARSFSMWIKATLDTNGNALSSLENNALLSYGTRKNGQRYTVRMDDDASRRGGIRVEVQGINIYTYTQVGTGGELEGSNRLADGGWHHLAVSFNPEGGGGPGMGRLKDHMISIDGCLFTTSSSDLVLNTGTESMITIGGREAGDYVHNLDPYTGFHPNGAGVYEIDVNGAPTGPFAPVVGFKGQIQDVTLWERALYPWVSHLDIMADQHQMQAMPYEIPADLCRISKPFVLNGQYKFCSRFGCPEFIEVPCNIPIEEYEVYQLYTGQYGKYGARDDLVGSSTGFSRDVVTDPVRTNWLENSQGLSNFDDLVGWYPVRHRFYEALTNQDLEDQGFNQFVVRDEKMLMMTPPTPSPTAVPTTASPTTASPTTASPTSASPTTPSPTVAPTTAAPNVGPPPPPTTASPTSAPTTMAPTTPSPTFNDTGGKGKKSRKKGRGDKKCKKRKGKKSKKKKGTKKYAQYDSCVNDDDCCEGLECRVREFENAGSRHHKGRDTTGQNECRAPCSEARAKCRDDNDCCAGHVCVRPGSTNPLDTRDHKNLQCISVDSAFLVSVEGKPGSSSPKEGSTSLPEGIEALLLSVSAGLVVATVALSTFLVRRKWQRQQAALDEKTGFQAPMQQSTVAFVAADNGNAEQLVASFEAAPAHEQVKPMVPEFQPRVAASFEAAV